jgi:hypothetical protein
VGHLLQCLEAAEHDVDVEIVRVKNRYDPAVDTTDSAGFRCAPPSKQTRAIFADSEVRSEVSQPVHTAAELASRGVQEQAS